MSHDLKSTERFSDRVADYVKYRPLYPAAVIDLVAYECGLQAEWQIADIGSGPGNLARLFLENGYDVCGVEPNEPMRKAGEELLGEFHGFTSVDGTAESTTLADASIDLIVAGQAFHWFRPEETRTEFKRILKPSGWVLLVWNDRNLEVDRLSAEYERILREMAPDYAEIRHAHAGDEAIEAFFGSPPKKQTFSNFQTLDREGFLGRTISASYFPIKGDPGHAAILAAMEKLFDEEQEDGHVRFVYDTQVFYDML